MKKKIAYAKKPQVKKTTRRTAHKRSEQAFFFPFTFRRVVLITTSLALFIFVFALVKSQPLTQAVAGVSIARGLFAQTTVALPNITGAASYNIYYRQKSETAFTNAVRNLSTTVTSYTISYLKKNTTYVYKISAVSPSGREFWWSDEKPLTKLQSM